MLNTKKKLLSVISIGVVCFIISLYFFQIGMVQGNSMLPTLKDKQIILIKKFNNDYSVGDIIVFKHDGIDGYVIKRIAQCTDKGEYYVLGDNSDSSVDSRYPEFGFVSREDIIGVVIE